MDALHTDPKDARIATLETQLLALSNSCESLRETCSKITSPWRRMSEVPTEEDADTDGYVIVRYDLGHLGTRAVARWFLATTEKLLVAWMPVPKFHGWPDPLADLLKSHGVEATQELTAALNAWKEVEK